uniref:Fe2OG dioxygenase domain-containing protein n=1 Tax=Schistosoma japonicum TaxID=6182 RepID=Q5D9B4_SCHJA|nr:unknown [Schistosoma japonicum]
MLKSLDSYQIKSLPPCVYYIPDFINEEEELELLKNIYTSPLPKWVSLRGRRLQNWGGLPHVKGMLAEEIPHWLQIYMDRISYLGLFGCNNSTDDNNNKANHALVNEYEPGQGIFPHHDGPLYYPVVATINLNSYGILDFYEPLDKSADPEAKSTLLNDRYVGSIYLKPRSLNIVAEQMYTHYMHGIAERENDLLIYHEDYLKRSEDLTENAAAIHNWTVSGLGDIRSQLCHRGKRVSVTIRYVPNVIKINWNKFFHRK